MASYISKKDDFGQKEIRPIRSEDLKPFKKNFFSQPLPGESDDVVIDWATKLVREAYQYKRGFHKRWNQNMMDYYTVPSFDAAQRSGVNSGIDSDQDTEVMVPALVKHFVDKGAFWLSREIFKVEPFMQFTNYELDTNIRKIQKLYERKIQGDTETYGAREKAVEVGIDLFLYGNAVMKAQFHQERIVTLEMPEPEINLSSEDDMLMDIDAEDPLAGINVEIGDPFAVYSVIDQYAEFKPVYLGHFFIDPIPSGRDWRRARYMGDVEFLSSEELMEKFGDIKGFSTKLERIENNTISYTSCPLTGETDEFLQNWCKFNHNGKEVSSSKSREIHSVTYFYTKYTETCIIDNKVVVYHRYRSKNVAKMGAYPYSLLKMPNPSGGLFSVGYGHTLRTLQLEQIILASKRLQTIEEMHKYILTYAGSAVDKSKIQNIQNLTLIEVDQPGAIQPIVPNHQAMAGFLEAESRNFQRAEQYSGIPSILDSSNTKTHLGAVPQRMEAAQAQFDVILDNARDAYKEIFQKIHILNMAYLEGELPIKGSMGPFDKEFNDSILDSSELMILANQPELSLQLNLGMDVGAGKLQAFAAVINTNPAAQMLQQLQQSGVLGPEKQMQLMGMLFELGGLTEFRPIFEVSPEELAMKQQEQAMSQQAASQQPGMEQGAPPQQPPMM
jgi:hypothetical protein